MMAATARKPFGARRPPGRKAPHNDKVIKYHDGMTPQLRNRVAYSICSRVYLGNNCACKMRGVDACSSMLDAASSAYLIIDDTK